MCSAGKLRRKCDRKNSDARNVRIYRSAFSPVNFWSRAGAQNFLIAFGTEGQRNAVLSSAIESIGSQVSYPIIIIGSSPDLEQNLIYKANEGRIGKLFISSPRFQNYDLFYGLPVEEVCDLFGKAAERNGVMDCYPVIDYTRAFLNILQSAYPTCLHSMLAMAELSNQQIADFGEEKEISYRDLNIIRHGEGSEVFRRILNQYRRAFQTIEGNQSTGISLCSMELAPGSVHLISADSAVPRLYFENLAAELRELIHQRYEGIFLVCNGINFENDNPLLDVVRSQKALGRFGYCCANPLVSQAGTENLLVNGFPSLVVLHSRAEDYADMQQILDRFGRYQHYEISETVHRGHLMSQFFTRDVKIGTIQYEKSRIEFEDMRLFNVVVRGDLGDTVSLYSDIREEW